MMEETKIGIWSANTAPKSLGTPLIPEVICFIKSANIFQIINQEGHEATSLIG